MEVGSQRTDNEGLSAFEDGTETTSVSIDRLLSPWPIVSTLSQYLPVGDLITLARLSVSLRAVLHGFEIPRDTSFSSKGKEPRSVRLDLNIGNHNTPYWQQLKDRAPNECASPIHTKGPEPKPCRYCSRPICDACIVRSSFARRHLGPENTFQNRVRHLCKTCWESGNPSSSQRFPLQSPDQIATTTSESKWYDPSGSTLDYCTCTLKSDGILCLGCKDIQNQEAAIHANSKCHGLDCNNIIDPDDKDKRRICLWCGKSLPRQIGGTTRYHWNQKMIEARARNAASRQADLEEYNRRRQKLLRMSRREMRGDEAVKDDSDADVPQFVRHLDTINYRSYMGETAAPSPETVFSSKRGHWQYNRAFLLEVGSRFTRSRQRTPSRTTQLQAGGNHNFACTHAEKKSETADLVYAIPSIPRRQRMQFAALKIDILEYFHEHHLNYEATQEAMLQEHEFEASIEQYQTAILIWTTRARERQASQMVSDESNMGTIANATNSRNPLSKITTVLRLRSGSDPSSVATGRIGTQDAEALDASTQHQHDDATRAAGKEQDKTKQGRRASLLNQRDIVLSSSSSSRPALPQIILQPPSSASSTSSPPPLPSPPSPIIPTGTGRDHIANDEEPPPYSADGWTWPDEEEEEAGQGHAEPEQNPDQVEHHPTPDLNQNENGSI